MNFNIYQLAQQSIQTNSLLAFPLVFLGGVLTSFTPCIYPVIPLLVGYIGGQKENSKFSGFFLSSFYVLGMAFTYSALGAFAALTGKFFGQIQNNPIVNLIVANIIILFGLSMLGLFSIPVPSWFGGATPKARKKGVLGAFGLGLASGFITAPCTVAILGALFAFIASKQSIFFGISLLFIYALGMGALLILAGTFTGFLTALPKSGRWMKRIQILFGLIMLAFGEYLIFQAGRFW